MYIGKTLHQVFWTFGYSCPSKLQCNLTNDSRLDATFVFSSAFALQLATYVPNKWQAAMRIALDKWTQIDLPRFAARVPFVAVPLAA